MSGECHSVLFVFVALTAWSSAAEASSEEVGDTCGSCRPACICLERPNHSRSHKRAMVRHACTTEKSTAQIIDYVMYI